MNLARHPPEGGGRLRLLARPNGASQAAVIDTIIVVPQRLSQFDSLSKNFDLLQRPGWCVGRLELVVSLRIEVLVVPILENRLENVLAKSAHSIPPSNISSPRGTMVAVRDAPNPIGDPSGPSYIASGTPKHSENPACWSNRFVWKCRNGRRPAVTQPLPFRRLGIIGGEIGESRKFGLLWPIPAVDATQKIPRQGVKNRQPLPASIRGTNLEATLERHQWGKAFPCHCVKGDFLDRRWLVKNRSNLSFPGCRWEVARKMGGRKWKKIFFFF